VQLAKDAYCDMGYNVILAPDFSLALFLAQKNLPDLIICTDKFTGGDGMTFLSEIKSDDQLAEIPFIFVLDTRNGNFDENAAADAGALSVFYHPLTPEWLKECTIPMISTRVSTKGRRPEESPE